LSVKMQQSHDIVIIGGGPAGYVAAIRAAQQGARVLLIEKEKLGGTCVNWGCVLTKVFLADVKPFYEIERSSLGLNEKEARDGGLDIHIGRFPFQCSAKAVAMRKPEGFVKLIADKRTGRLLGAHIIGIPPS